MQNPNPYDDPQDEHGSGYPPPPPPHSGSRQNPNTWAMVCHLSALAMFVVPLGNVLGPLVVWLIKRDEMPSVNEHGRESINFQISMTIWMAIAGVLILVFIGALILPVLFIADLILLIVAAVKANDGGFYRYPLTIRFF